MNAKINDILQWILWIVMLMIAIALIIWLIIKV